MNDEGPKTLIEAVRYFSDKKVCHEVYLPAVPAHPREVQAVQANLAVLGDRTMPTLLAQQIAAMPDAEPLWLGPCAEGPNGGVTQSMLQSYLGCRERFRLKYVLGLEPQPRFAKAMEYGNMWHACEEALAALPPTWTTKMDDPSLAEFTTSDNGPVGKALDAYATKLLAKYPMQRDEVDIGGGILHGPWRCSACGWYDGVEADLARDADQDAEANRLLSNWSTEE